MAEEEEYRSSEDEDYVPSDGEEGPLPKRSRRGTREPSPPKLTEEPAAKETEEAGDPDDLWADFLAEAGEAPPKDKPSTSAVEPPPKQSLPSPSPAATEPKEEEKPKTVEQIFQFAGEEVRVETTAPEGASGTQPPKEAKAGKKGGGLSSVLSSLSKAPKLSTLSKSKLDWDAFKASEGLAEELETHNRGRDGFLSKQDFLQETDLRQFQRERTAREKTRKNPFS